MTRDRGIILVNVLVALALGAAIIVLMFTSQEVLVDRSRRAATATQAEALALGAEASAVAALRRDRLAGDETDNYTESWARTAQEAAELRTGRFEVAVTDVQGRFNLNLLAVNSLNNQQILARLVALVELPEEVAGDIVAHMLRSGPQIDLSQIRTLSSEARKALRPHVAFLPQDAIVNANTATPQVLTAVLGNPSLAQRLLRARQRKGFVTPADVADAGIVALTGAGYTSDVFDVAVSAEVDGTVAHLQSRILRQARPETVAVSVIARRFGVVSDGNGIPPLEDPMVQ